MDTPGSKRSRHCLLLAVALLAASGIGSADAQTRWRALLERRQQAATQSPLPPGAVVERDVAYGADPRQRFDVYRPAGAYDAPVLLMVHGGGWRRGDKGNPGVAANKAAYWLPKGFAVVSVDYRMLPAAGPLQQARDVAAALAAVQRGAARWRIDPARVLLMGHSAGAHLVALLGASDALWRQAGARRPLGVVSLDSAALDVPQLMARPRVPQLYRDAFGTDPAFWTAASPRQQLDHQAVPMLLVCSTQRLGSCPQSRALQDTAARLGVPVRVLPQDLSHGEIDRTLGLASEYTRGVDAWIEALPGMRAPR